MVQFKIFVNIDDFSCVTLWAQNVLIPSTYMLLWKLCLNLWNRMWLDPSLSLILSFKPLGLWKWKVLFSGDLMESYIRFWKSTKLPEFPLFQSKSFHSITVTGTQNVLNISILNIKMRNGFVMSCHIHLPTIIDEIFWEFIVSAKLWFAASKTEIDTQYNNFSIRVASRVAEQLKTFGN